jgi:succinyl-CoA synthetase beta subunit
MRLLEHQGKKLLARYGVPLPRGALWPKLPPGVEDLVVKIQVPEGGRGKGGGVRFAASPGQAGDAARQLLDEWFGGTEGGCVYLEERLEIAEELYLAVSLDRDHRCYSILASRQGGVEVESVAAEDLLRLPVPVLSGLANEALGQVIAFLGLCGATAEAAAWIIPALHDLALTEDTELVEINPLVVTPEGALVAADAKVVLDPNAAFRHPGWRDYQSTAPGSAVERTIAEAGGVAVEIDPAGDIVAAVSGAGLMMATLDMIVAGGGRPRLMIDLGGIVLGSSEAMVPLFSSVSALSPKATFINAYMQTALCDDFARALAAAYSAAPFAGRLVVRLKGRHDEAAREILSPFGFEIHRDLAPALAATLAVTGEG